MYTVGYMPHRLWLSGSFLWRRYEYIQPGGVHFASSRNVTAGWNVGNWFIATKNRQYFPTMTILTLWYIFWFFHLPTGIQQMPSCWAAIPPSPSNHLHIKRTLCRHDHDILWIVRGATLPDRAVTLLWADHWQQQFQYQVCLCPIIKDRYRHTLLHIWLPRTGKLHVLHCMFQVQYIPYHAWDTYHTIHEMSIMLITIRAYAWVISF